MPATRRSLFVFLTTIAAVAGCRSAHPDVALRAAGNDVRPAWGEAVNGLQVGVAAVTKGKQSDPPAGGPVAVLVALKNGGSSPVRLLVPLSLYLSGHEPHDAAVVVRAASPNDARPIYFAGPAGDGSRLVVLQPGQTVSLPGTIHRAAWPGAGDGQFAQTQLTARYQNDRPSADAFANAERRETVRAADLWRGVAKSRAATVVVD